MWHQRCAGSYAAFAPIHTFGRLEPAAKSAWQEGARSAGKDPATMPILLEHFISVGGADEAKVDAEEQAIQKWVQLGVTHIFVHSAQRDQPAVVDFFGKHVLPLVRGGGVTGVRQVVVG